MTPDPDASLLIIEASLIPCDAPFLLVKPGAHIRVTVYWQEKKRGRKQNKIPRVKERILLPGQYSLKAIIADKAIVHAFLTFEERGGMQKHFVVKRKSLHHSFLVSEILGFRPDMPLIS